MARTALPDSGPASAPKRTFSALVPSGFGLRAAMAIWLLTLGFVIGFVGFVPANRSTDSGFLFVTALVAVLLFQGMATIGVLIVRQEPRNAVGWIFCASPMLMMFANFAGAYAEYAANTNPGVLPGATTAMVLGNIWQTGMALFISFVLLLFPDGQLPSRRWRPVVWIGVAALILFAAGAFLAPGRLSSPLERFQNPYGINGAQYLELAGLAIPFVALAGIVAAIVRYRRGTPMQRQQLRWVVAAGVAIAALVGATLLVDSLAGVRAPDLVVLVYVSLFPLAVGAAILRYRLYEIDVIIRKTFIYAALAMALGLLYLGGISLTTWVFRSLTGQSGALAVTLSTLAVAAAFQPLRTHIQRVIDHRFYRRKYDTSQTLDAFSNRLREQIDLDALHEEVLSVVAETVQPSHATLWLRSSER